MPSERIPASVRRATIHDGVGRVGSTSRTMRVTNSDAPTRPRIGAPSATTDLNASVVCETSAHARTPGSRKSAPVACEYSRATPRIDSA